MRLVSLLYLLPASSELFAPVRLFCFAELPTGLVTVLAMRYPAGHGLGTVNAIGSSFKRFCPEKIC